MNSLKDLMIACLRADYSRSEENDFDNTKAYEVQFFEEKVVYWNSSNSQPINHKEVLERIADELEEGMTEGTVSDPYSMAEIMFEVK